VFRTVDQRFVSDKPKLFKVMELSSVLLYGLYVDENLFTCFFFFIVSGHSGTNQNKREGSTELSGDPKTNSAKLSWFKVEPIGPESKETDAGLSKCSNVS
jgi:hypothetical protein